MRFTEPPIGFDLRGFEDEARAQIASAFGVPFHVWYGDKQTKQITIRIGSRFGLIRLWWLKKRGWKTRHVASKYPNAFGYWATWVIVILTR